MIYDLRNNRIPLDKFSKFLRTIAANWEVAARSILPELIFIEVRNSKPDEFILTGSTVPVDSRECSRVMIWEDFFAYNLHQSKIPFAIRGHVTKSQLDAIERFGIKGSTKGRMETSLPFCWVTHTKEMEAIREEPDAASRSRTRLGLKHFMEDEILLEILFPEDVSMAARVTHPTFFEGGPHLIYRSKQGPDGWGRAVDLCTYEDGFAEAIHESVLFSDDFTIRVLGIVNPPSNSFDWDIHLEHFPIKWENDLWKEFEMYV
jgi:hypothetical protein